MLTERAINALIASGRISWTGATRGDGLLLRLGGVLQPLIGTADAIVDVADQASIDALYGNPLIAWETYELRPQAMVLATVDRPLRLDNRTVGVIGTLSHLARLGLGIHVDSPLVLPGWDGTITLELHNASPATLLLHAGMPVGRIVLTATDGEPSPASAHPFYGHEAHLGSRYAAEFGPVISMG